MFIPTQIEQIHLLVLTIDLHILIVYFICYSLEIIFKQLDDELSKREWKGHLKMWGKRGGWNNLHGGWGVKRSNTPLWGDQVNYYSQPIDKRAWQNLQVSKI